MSLVDFGKSFHHRAADHLCGRPILFIHVPKCGGTSVGRALRRAYILSQGTVKPHESQQAFEAARSQDHRVTDVYELREMMLLYLLFCGTRCVSAHVPFSDVAFNNFGTEYSFVTILRDPVRRFLSNYYWSQRDDRSETVRESLADFLDTERARQAGSTYVRYFCGEPGLNKFTHRHVDRAVANLRRIHCVGFLDEIDRFEVALRQLTGRRIRFGMENVGKKRGPRNSAPSEDLQRKVIEACAPDREIWDAVQDLRSRPVTSCASGEISAASHVLPDVTAQ